MCTPRADNPVLNKVTYQTDKAMVQAIQPLKLIEHSTYNFYKTLIFTKGKNFFSALISQ